MFKFMIVSSVLWHLVVSCGLLDGPLTDQPIQAHRVGLNHFGLCDSQRDEMHIINLPRSTQGIQVFTAEFLANSQKAYIWHMCK